MLGRRQVSDTAAHLQRYRRSRGDGLHGVQVNRASVARALKVDDVQPAGALSLPLQCDGYGVVGKDLLPVVVTLVEPHAAAALQVDGGDDVHAALAAAGRSGGSSRTAAGPNARSSPGGTASPSASPGRRASRTSDVGRRRRRVARIVGLRVVAVYEVEVALLRHPFEHRVLDWNDTLLHPMCGTFSPSSRSRTRPGRTPKHSTSPSSDTSNSSCSPRQTPKNGTPPRIASRTGSTSSRPSSARIAESHAPCPGRMMARAFASALGRLSPPAPPQVLQGLGDAPKVARAVVHHCYFDGPHGEKISMNSSNRPVTCAPCVPSRRFVPWSLPVYISRMRGSVVAS